MIFYARFNLEGCRMKGHIDPALIVSSDSLGLSFLSFFILCLVFFYVFSFSFVFVFFFSNLADRISLILRSVRRWVCLVASRSTSTERQHR